MLYGLILSVRKADLEKGIRWLNLLVSPVGLLIMFVLIYSVIHLLTWALIRYRLPVDAVLIPFAALAVSHLARRSMRNHRFASTD